MTTITEIAPDVYRISTYVREIDLQFNQSLIKDEQPLVWRFMSEGPRAFTSISRFFIGIRVAKTSMQAIMRASHLTHHFACPASR
jgi:hypothetical protein